MKYVCQICGYVHEGENAPEACPQCKAPASKFAVQQSSEGAIKIACEHMIGGHDDIDPEVREGLKANFMGECTEVGMYLAMSRQADREGYPEIAEAYKRYAFEEAEHAAKFAELLGEVLSSSTEKNLRMRVEAEPAPVPVSSKLPSAPKNSATMPSTIPCMK